MTSTPATMSPQAPPAGWLLRLARRFSTNRSGMVAAGFLVLLTLLAVAAPWIAPYDPLEQDLRNTLADPSASHWLGTDELGRDVLARLLYAARISLAAAVQAVSVALAIGVPPGLLSGYLGGRVDGTIMRFTDAVMSFPPLVLAIALVGVLGPNLRNAMLAVGIVFSPRFLRLVRGTVLSVREETYIEASQSIGTPTFMILHRHVLPNVISPVIVQASLLAGFAMLSEAGLSFLGLGVQPPDASWGSMLGTAYGYINRSSLLIIWPGIAIASTVLAFNVLGDGLSDSLGREERRAS